MSQQRSVFHADSKEPRNNLRLMVLKLHSAVSHSFYKQDQFECTFSYQSAEETESHRKGQFLR